MRFLLVRLLLLPLSACLFTLTAAEPAPAPVLSAHVDDPSQLLPLDPPAARLLEAKLADFEHSTGTKILVQFHAKSPPAEEDKQPGAYMHTLATKLGTARRGALAVYFADEDDWRIWVGDNSTAGFVGHPGTAKELTKSGAIHDTKEALFTAARAQADAAFAKLKAAAPPGQPPTVSQRIALQADAILDRLIGKLGL